MIKSFLICAATVVAVGCSTAPSSDINKSYDVSRKVTLPDVSGAKPYSVVVGLLTLKGDQTKLSPEAFIDGLAKGDFYGTATFSSSVEGDASFLHQYRNWRTTDLVNQVTVTTQEQKTTVSPTTKKVPVGFGFELLRGIEPTDRILKISANVPAWEESRPFAGVVVPTFFSLDWGCAIDTRKRGWQVVYKARDAIMTRPGTDVVIMYIR